MINLLMLREKTLAVARTPDLRSQMAGKPKNSPSLKFWTWGRVEAVATTAKVSWTDTTDQILSI